MYARSCAIFCEHLLFPDVRNCTCRISCERFTCHFAAGMQRLELLPGCRRSDLWRATVVLGAQALPRRRPCGEGPKRRASHLRRGPEVHHVSDGGSWRCPLARVSMLWRSMLLADRRTIETCE